MLLSLSFALVFAATPQTFEGYLGQVQKRVQSAWKMPAKSEKLQATVAFTIDRAGRVTELRVAKSSGRKDFDGSALEAVRSVTPFPPLISILKRSETRDVEIRFRPNSVVALEAKAPPGK
ncbi:MAG TPA: energy transducer TonB [candidate division Zixibacteria bacterium]|nr:energy transducer TonB [candidate division Zixibacteria bacterium]